MFSSREVAHLRALLIKKFLVWKRDKKFIIVGSILPIIGTILVIIIQNVLSKSSSNPQSTLVSDIPQVFPYTFVNCTSYNPTLINELTDIGNTPVSFDSVTQINSAILNTTQFDNSLGGFIFSQISNTFCSLSVMYNSNSDLSFPVMVQKIAKAIYGMNLNENLVINEKNFPLPAPVTTYNAFPLFGPVILEYTIVFMVPLFAMQIVAEREKKLKHSLLVNSVSLPTYWLSTFVFDFLVFFVVMMINLILLYATQVKPISDNNFAGPFFLYFFFGIAGIPCGYIISFMFSKEETGNRWLYSVVSIISIIPYLIATVALNNNVSRTADYGLSIIPPYALLRGLTILSNASTNGGLSLSQTFSSDGLGVIYLIQILFAIFIWFLLALIENISIGRIFKKKSNSVVPNLIQGEDIDVTNERTRITNSANKDMIYISSLHKTFPPLTSGQPPKVAVGNVTFGVPAGECFALLGPNSAGKTTLLSILSGQLEPDYGNGCIDGYSIISQRAQAFQSLGFCPQFDVLWDLLTGREHLRFFARLKMVPESEIEDSIQLLLTKFGLMPWADKFSSTYSGGTKRKLSAAISLTGDPKVVFMDEPSTGMDASARRELWKIIGGMREGRSIILTTHSMLEAETLCSRIGIMVKGNLRCLGTSQHLKDKYGNGYRLIISASPLRKEEIQEWIHEIYPQAQLKEALGGTINFEIPQEFVSIPNTFKLIEENRQRLGIIDYTMSQTSLEQVFLRFAVEQEEADSVQN